MAKISYWIDKGEKTANIYSKLVKKFFPHLKKAQLLLTMRDGEKTDDEGNLIVATARKVSSKERDLWGHDFEICMDEALWAKASLADKYRIGFHELLHCGVDLEEGTNEPIFDDNNRLKTHILKHDIWLKTFKNEIEIFGFEGADKDVAEFMTEMMEDKEKIKKAKKKFLGDLGIEIYKAQEETIKKKKKRPVAEKDEDDMELNGDPVKKKKKKKIEATSTSTRMSTNPAKALKKKKRPVDDDEDED